MAYVIYTLLVVWLADRTRAVRVWILPYLRRRQQFSHEPASLQLTVSITNEKLRDMETRLYSKQKLRVTTNPSKNNWVDIASGEWEQALEVSFLTSQQYLEIRKKDGQICSFYFESKRHKKDYDFGWWTDAEVVFANNDVQHK